MKGPTIRSVKSGVLRRWLIVGAAVAALAIAAVAILMAVEWPFTQSAVTQALEDRFARNVTIRQFRSTWFPPGFVAQGVEFLHRQRKDLPPLITDQTLTVRADYTGLLRINQRLHHVQVTGLHVLVPPKDPRASQQTFPLTTSVSGKNLILDEITADDAVLEFLAAQPAADKFVLAIAHLTFNDVGEAAPFTFHARFSNTEPPGEIRSDGRFGPWNDNDPAASALSGSYIYDHVKLTFFEGLAGTLSSRGKFSGTLGHIAAEGDIDIPDFQVAGAGHPVHLTSKYNAVVNGTNGDTDLTSVESYFGKTTVNSRGDVKGRPGQHGKTATLTMSVGQGRVEDLLRLFTEARPAETGDVRLQTKVELPPGPQAFLRRLRLEGDFGIASSRFTDPAVQQPINRLAESARGETKDKEKVDPATALSNLKGHVFSANGGLAKLSRISFTEPDTYAEIEGTYNLVDKSLNLSGVLHTNGKLADTKSGFKSVVLKALNPFLKKNL